MQHLLQSKKIPRSLRRVRCVRSIRDAFERRVEQKRDNYQNDGKNFDGKNSPEEHFRIGLHLIFIGRPYLCGGSSRYKYNTPGCLANVRAEARNKVLLVAHRGSFVDTRVSSRGTRLGSLFWT